VKALLAVVVLLLGLAVLGDRVAAGYAEDEVARQIADRAAVVGIPEVEIDGSPFVTQVVGGRYDDVRISLTAAELGRGEGTRVDVALHGVRVPLSGLLSGTVQELPVERIDGTASLSYELLAAELGAGTHLEREGDGVRITRTVELLGRQLPLTAAGQIALEGEDLVIDVDEASGAGVDLPDRLLDGAEDLLDLRYTVPALPFGLQLTGVSPGEDGVDVRVEATDAVLRAAE
jgi:hypothetical protein